MYGMAPLWTAAQWRLGSLGWSLRLLLSAAAILRVSSLRPSTDGGVSVGAAGHFQHIHQAIQAVLPESLVPGAGVKIMQDTSSIGLDPETGNAMEGSPNFKGLNGNIIVKHAASGVDHWVVRVQKSNDDEVNVVLPLSALGAEDATAAAYSEKFHPGQEERVIANTNSREVSHRGQDVVLLAEDKQGPSPESRIWYVQDVDGDGLRQNAQIPEADMRPVKASVLAKLTGAAGHDLVGHMVKINWNLRSGEKLGAISGYEPDSGQYSVLFPKAGEQLLHRTEFEELPSHAESKALVGTNVHFSHIRHGAHSARILAAGVNKHHVVAIGEEDLESGGKMVLLSPDDFLSEEQLRRLKGVRDPREAHETAEETKARKEKEMRNRAAARIAAEAEDGSKAAGAHLMNSEEWHKWADRGDFSEKLKKELGRDLGDTGKEMDDAMASLRARSNAVVNLADKANDAFKQYGIKLAGKAKMLGQVEYKGHALPIEATEVAERNEAYRNQPFEIIHSLAEKHQDFVHKYNSFEKHVQENSAQFRKMMNDEWDLHNAASKEKADGLVEEKLLEPSEADMEFKSGDYVQLKSVKGDVEHALVGYIGQLTAPELTCVPNHINSGITGKLMCESNNAKMEGSDAQFQYVYNMARGTAEAVCGKAQECDCCRRNVQRNEHGKIVGMALSVAVPNDEEAKDVEISDLAEPGTVDMPTVHTDMHAVGALEKNQAYREHLLNALEDARARKDDDLVGTIEAQTQKLDAHTKELAAAMDNVQRTEREAAEFDTASPSRLKKIFNMFKAAKHMKVVRIKRV